ncbi:hypothetical protein SAMN05216338_1001870 [Bradyrhizobium sp. Rc2d]|uniref:hypothetical protein n=1 Tax=Bradyrhizobium sp. Rc2d TaxID=1855321 RepID=UPI00088E6EB8|nr:hypothetical protein [Bradyrhizobium sp. Rc2d]SDG60168.1 hypothetical protein SAMN05216338_1001870 [Bradyrhizobium sp. Rc2d]
MTDEHLAAGALSAGIDLPGTDGAPHVSDIAAMIHEFEARIALHDVGETASTWLANARSALKRALQYVEEFAEVEAKAKTEVSAIKDRITTVVAARPLSDTHDIQVYSDGTADVREGGQRHRLIMTTAPETDDPLHAVTRSVEGDVIVRWSELTDAEREQAWRDYEKAFGTAAEKEAK